MKPLPFYYRLTARLVLICFLVNQPQLFAQPALPPVSSKLFFSGSEGRLESEFTGSSYKKILYIQDAHTSLEAQRNIARLIELAVKKEGVMTVFEEGFEGSVPTDDYFGFMKNTDAKEKTADYFLEQLRLGGAEYAHILRKKDFKLVGIDQAALHARNLAAAQQAGKERQEVAEDLKKMAAAFRQAAALRFPRKAQQWFRLETRHDKNEIDPVHYLKRIRQEFPGLIENNTFPQIHQLLQAVAEDLQDPVNLSRFDAAKLFKEIQSLEETAAKMLLPNPDDFKLHQMIRAVGLLQKLNRLELTAPEYEAVRELLSSFTTREAAASLFKVTHKPLVLSAYWEKHIAAAKRFYETARERDDWAAQKLQDWIRNSPEQTAVLVFGGFHKDQFLSFFRENGISYQSIIPAISTQDEKHQHLYQSLLDGGPGMMDISLPDAVRYYSLYDAPNGQTAAAGIYYASLYGKKVSSRTESRIEKKQGFPRIYDPNRPEKKKAFGKIKAGKKRTAMKAPPQKIQKRSELRRGIDGGSAVLFALAGMVVAIPVGAEMVRWRHAASNPAAPAVERFQRPHPQETRSENRNSKKPDKEAEFLSQALLNLSEDLRDTIEFSRYLPVQMEKVGEFLRRQKEVQFYFDIFAGMADANDWRIAESRMKLALVESQISRLESRLGRAEQRNWILSTVYLFAALLFSWSHAFLMAFSRSYAVKCYSLWLAKEWTPESLYFWTDARVHSDFKKRSLSFEKNIDSTYQHARRGEHDTLFYPAAGTDVLRVLLAFDVREITAVDIEDPSFEGEFSQLGIKGVSIRKFKEKGYHVKEFSFWLAGKYRKIRYFIGDAASGNFLENKTHDVVYVYRPGMDLSWTMTPEHFEYTRENGFIAFQEREINSPQHTGRMKRLQIHGRFNSNQPAFIYQKLSGQPTNTAYDLPFAARRTELRKIEKDPIIQEAVKKWLQKFSPADLDKWIVAPGMDYGSPIQWWGRHDPRPQPLGFHAGVDFLIYRDKEGRLKRAAPDLSVPVILGGTVKAVFEDDMAKTVLIQTSYRQNGKVFTFVYTHIHPRESLIAGTVVRAGETLGTLALSKNPNSSTHPHFHLQALFMDESLFPLPEDLNYPMLDQWFVEGKAALIDPLRLFQTAYRKKNFLFEYPYAVKTVLTVSADHAGVLKNRISLNFPGVNVQIAKTPEGFEKKIRDSAEPFDLFVLDEPALIDPETLSRRFPDAHIKMAGISDEDLESLFERQVPRTHFSQTPTELHREQIEEILEAGNTALISLDQAHQPASSGEAEAFENRLAALGLSFVRVYGQFARIPQPSSYLILNTNKKTALYLAQEFQQQSMLYLSGRWKAEMVQVSSPHREVSGRVILEDENHKNSYTRISLAGGEEIYLSWTAVPPESLENAKRPPSDRAENRNASEPEKIVLPQSRGVFLNGQLTDEGALKMPVSFSLLSSERPGLLAVSDKDPRTAQAGLHFLEYSESGYGWNKSVSLQLPAGTQSLYTGSPLVVTRSANTVYSSSRPGGFSEQFLFAEGASGSLHFGHIIFSAAHSLNGSSVTVEDVTLTPREITRLNAIPKAGVYDFDHENLIVVSAPSEGSDEYYLFKRDRYSSGGWSEAPVTESQEAMKQIRLNMDEVMAFQYDAESRGIWVLGQDRDYPGDYRIAFFVWQANPPASPGKSKGRYVLSRGSKFQDIHTRLPLYGPHRSNFLSMAVEPSKNPRILILDAGYRKLYVLNTAGHFSPFTLTHILDLKSLLPPTKENSYPMTFVPQGNEQPAPLLIGVEGGVVRLPPLNEMLRREEEIVPFLMADRPSFIHPQHVLPLGLWQKEGIFYLADPVNPPRVRRFQVPENRLRQKVISVSERWPEVSQAEGGRLFPDVRRVRRDDFEYPDPRAAVAGEWRIEIPGKGENAPLQITVKHNGAEARIPLRTKENYTAYLYSGDQVYAALNTKGIAAVLVTDSTSRRTRLWIGQLSRKSQSGPIQYESRLSEYEISAEILKPKNTVSGLVLNETGNLFTYRSWQGMTRASKVGLEEQVFEEGLVNLDVLSSVEEALSRSEARAESRLEISGGTLREWIAQHRVNDLAKWIQDSEAPLPVRQERARRYLLAAGDIATQGYVQTAVRNVFGRVPLKDVFYALHEERIKWFERWVQTHESFPGIGKFEEHGGVQRYLEPKGALIIPSPFAVSFFGVEGAKILQQALDHTYVYGFFPYLAFLGPGQMEKYILEKLIPNMREINRKEFGEDYTVPDIREKRGARRAENRDFTAETFFEYIKSRQGGIAQLKEIAEHFGLSPDEIKHSLEEWRLEELREQNRLNPEAIVPIVVPDHVTMERLWKILNTIQEFNGQLTDRSLRERLGGHARLSRYIDSRPQLDALILDYNHNARIQGRPQLQLVTLLQQRASKRSENEQNRREQLIKTIENYNGMISVPEAAQNLGVSEQVADTELGKFPWTEVNASRKAAGEFLFFPETIHSRTKESWNTLLYLLERVGGVAATQELADRMGVSIETIESHYRKLKRSGAWDYIQTFRKQLNLFPLTIIIPRPAGETNPLKNHSKITQSLSGLQERSVLYKVFDSVDGYYRRLHALRGFPAFRDYVIPVIYQNAAEQLKKSSGEKARKDIAAFFNKLMEIIVRQAPDQFVEESPRGAMRRESAINAYHRIQVIRALNTSREAIQNHDLTAFKSQLEKAMTQPFLVDKSIYPRRAENRKNLEKALLGRRDFLKVSTGMTISGMTLLYQSPHVLLAEDPKTNKVTLFLLSHGTVEDFERVKPALDKQIQKLLSAGKKVHYFVEAAELSDELSLTALIYRKLKNSPELQEIFGDLDAGDLPQNFLVSSQTRDALRDLSLSGVRQRLEVMKESGKISDPWIKDYEQTLKIFPVLHSILEKFQGIVKQTAQPASKKITRSEALQRIEKLFEEYHAETDRAYAVEDLVQTPFAYQLYDAALFDSAGRPKNFWSAQELYLRKGPFKNEIGKQFMIHREKLGPEQIVSYMNATSEYARLFEEGVVSDPRLLVSKKGIPPQERFYQSPKGEAATRLQQVRQSYYDVIKHYGKIVLSQRDDAVAEQVAAHASGEQDAAVITRGWAHLGLSLQLAARNESFLPDARNMLRAQGIQADLNDAVLTEDELAQVVSGNIKPGLKRKVDRALVTGLLIDLSRLVHREHLDAYEKRFHKPDPAPIHERLIDFLFTGRRSVAQSLLKKPEQAEVFLVQALKLEEAFTQVLQKNFKKLKETPVPEDPAVIAGWLYASYLAMWSTDFDSIPAPLETEEAALRLLNRSITEGFYEGDPQALLNAFEAEAEKVVGFKPTLMRKEHFEKRAESREPEIEAVLNWWNELAQMRDLRAAGEAFQNQGVFHWENILGRDDMARFRARVSYAEDIFSRVLTHTQSVTLSEDQKNISERFKYAIENMVQHSLLVDAKAHNVVASLETKQHFYFMAADTGPGMNIKNVLAGTERGRHSNWGEGFSESLGKSLPEGAEIRVFSNGQELRFSGPKTEPEYEFFPAPTGRGTLYLIKLSKHRAENRLNGTSLPASSSAGLIYNHGFSEFSILQNSAAPLPPFVLHTGYRQYEIHTVMLRKLVQETADQFSRQQGRPFLAQVYGGAFYLAHENGYRIMSNEWDDIDIQITDAMDTQIMQQFTDLLAVNLKRLTPDLEIVTRVNHGLKQELLRHKDSGREILLAYHVLSDITGQDWIRKMYRWLSGFVPKYINSYLLMERLIGDEDLFYNGLQKKERRETPDFVPRAQELIGLLGQAISDTAQMESIASTVQDRVKKANRLAHRAELRVFTAAENGKAEISRGRENPPEESIRKSLRETRDSSVLFIPYAEMQSPKSKLRRQVFALAKQMRSSGSKIVLYGADPGDEDFKNLSQVKLIREDFQQALFHFGNPQGRNLVAARSRGELLKHSSQRVSKRVRAFLLKRPADIYAAYLAAVSDNPFAGVSEDAEGIISVTGEFLKAELRSYQASLVIQMAA